MAKSPKGDGSPRRRRGEPESENRLPGLFDALLSPGSERGRTSRASGTGGSDPDSSPDLVPDSSADSGVNSAPPSAATVPTASPSRAKGPVNPDEAPEADASSVPSSRPSRTKRSGPVGAHHASATEDHRPDTAEEAHHEAAPPAGTRARPLSVGELNRTIQEEIEGAHPSVWITGEISNLNRYSSGHLYFTLKDAVSEIAAVMFASANRRLRFRPDDGTQVLASGRPTVWVPRGRYQFLVEEMEPRGRGSLLEAFEALKQRLLAEGLFDQARKRPIPLLPRRVGLVTSPHGAALRDILKVLHRRHGGVDVLIAPARVQGEGAAGEIAAGIDALGRFGGIDVLIVGRGGGSIEDLWAFNEEAVARAIVACPVPVISAVGHETDVTIADFAADVRAATPSHAAEIVVASRADLLDRLDGLQARLGASLRAEITDARRRLERAASRPALAGFPSIVAGHGQTLDDLAARAAASLRDRLSDSKRRASELSLRLAPRHLLEVVRRRRDRVVALARQIVAARPVWIGGRRARLEGAVSLLNSLSPLAVLERGYAICLDPARGRVLRSSDEVHPGQGVEVRLAQGVLECAVVATRATKENAS